MFKQHFLYLQTELDDEKENISRESMIKISSDYFDSCDQDEIYCSGFGLIGTEPFPVRAVCFLCGSAGKEPVL